MNTLPRKRLPIGIQTFRKIREDNCYYVDKTSFAIDLVDQGSCYFLSRPRRFGKSLFLDTLKEMFEGAQDMFTGLVAQTRWDWRTRYPVIRISFSDGVLRNRQELDQRIGEILLDNQKRLGVHCSHQSYSGQFAELIALVHESGGQRAVLLIDEYDKPILDNLTDRAAALEMREGLKNLYSVIKGADPHLKFVFLTGVSKFSKVSLFSGLNNLKDITLDPRYSAICGYTQQDVDTVFAPELQDIDQTKIRQWYNGYNWLGTPVYNPFDLLLLFDSREFKPYWFETGTPSFLINLLTERQTWLPELTQLQSDADLLSSFDVDHISTEALMFQAGYLTLEPMEQIGASQYYKLRFPNLEVFQSLHISLLRAWTPDAQQNIRGRMQLYRLLQANDFAALQTLFTAFFAGIPHQWFTNNPIAQYEGYYASVFYSYFAALGLDITCEESSNAGRLDMAVKFNGQIYLFEFKVVELVPEGRALQQIIDKGYAYPHLASGQPIHLIGVEFSRTSRSVVGFEVQTLQHQ